MSKGKVMVLREELKQFLGNAKKEMKQLYEKIKQHPLTCLTCIIAIVTAIVLLIALPYWRVAQFGITDPKDLAEIENSYRATLAQILGGIAVGIGIYFAWGNLTTAREGQITERFTRAVDQLGSDKLEIRLGGIYALERISTESEKDYWPIMEVLTNFIRINSHVEDWDNKIRELKSPKVEHIDDKYKVRFDIQAAINVIGRRKYVYRAGEQKRLYLRHTYLRMISCADALEGAHFEGAFLDFSDLIGAYLNGAHLQEVYFTNSCLNWAQLEKASLNGAHLERTYFRWANLSSADLSNADLSNADLADANLEGTNFIGAKNLKIEQLSKAKTLYKATLDEELDKLLREKYPALIEKPKDESRLFR